MNSLTEELFSSKVLVGSRYRPTAFLGQGGMGWVILADDTMLKNQQVVLKLLFPHLLQDEGALTRFRNELLVARKLVHPNIVRTYTFSSCEHVGHYIVMEYVEGCTLKQLIADKHPELLELREALRLVSVIAESVYFAHRLGIVHLDIKPENILLAGGTEIKLADFGLAQVLRLRKEGDSNAMIGTPYYMAPEQFRSDLLDQRTDVYALGIVAYEVISGRLPFQADTLYNLAQQHLSAPFPPLSAARPGTPGWLDALLQKCCAKDREDRFQTLDELLSILSYSEPLLKRVPAVLDSAHGYEIPLVRRTPRWLKFLERRDVRMVIFGGLAIILLLLAHGNPVVNPPFVYAALWIERETGVELHFARAFLRIQTGRGDQIYHDTPFIDVLGHKRVGWAMLRLGADVTTTDENGWSPLHVAVGRGMPLPYTLELLSFGADPNAKNREGNTPLHLAAGELGRDMLSVLLNAGAELNVRNNYGATPLIEAVRREDTRVISALLSAGADHTVVDNEGWSALMRAVETGSVEAVRMLIKAGAEAEAPGGASASDVPPRKNKELIRKMVAEVNRASAEAGPP